MADQPIRVYKVGVELIALAAGRGKITRQVVQVMADQSSSTAIRVYKVGMEVIALAAAVGKITRQTLSVMGQQDSESGIEVYKFGIEVLSNQPKKGKITRQNLNVLSPQAGNSSAIKVFKFGIELICRAGPRLIQPLPTPDYWEVFAHNWDTKQKISTRYMTDVTHSSITITEDRIGLLEKPLRTVHFSWTSTNRASTYELLLALKKLTEARMFVPLYSDILEITQYSPGGPSSFDLYCDPGLRRFFVNQRIAVVKLYEDAVPAEVYLYEIDEIEPGKIVTKTGLAAGGFTPGRYVIFPLMDTEVLLKPKFQYIGPHAGKVTMKLQEIAGDSTIPPTFTGMPEEAPSYGDYPIFHFHPDWKRPPSVTPTREGKRVEQGRTHFVYTKGDSSRVLHNFSLQMEREEFFQFLNFFDSRRGRLVAFWFIDLDWSWTFQAISGVDDKFVDVTTIGDFYYFEEDIEYVGIVLYDGTHYVRKVDAVQDYGNYYRLVVDQALPEIDPSKVDRVARARVSRFNKDEMSEEWTTNTQVTVKTSIKELLNEEIVEMT